jgi:hypothetical protein
MKLCLLFAVFAMAASAQMNVKVQDDRILIDLQGKPYTAFYIKGAEVTKPYLWPLRSASGKVMTRQFPMEAPPNEPHDHLHHRGLWFAHENVNGVDFWNNDASYTAPPPRGRIVFEKVTKAKGGKFATLGVTMAWMDPDGRKLLGETRVMEFHNTPTLRMVNLDITLTAATKVVMGDAKDGTLGIRLNPAIQEEKTYKEDGKTFTIPGTPGVIVNAEGVMHEKDVWGKPSNWVDYTGEIDGEKLGIAILDHPSNSRRARWHVRAYGLFAANPFGDAVFTNDKSRDGSVALEPGASLHFRYLVVIHPGDAAAAGIPRIWNDFASNVKLR